MNLHFSGGAMEIGGSCIYVRIAGRGILLDAGIRQSAAKDPIPDFRTIQEQGGVDAIIVSHAHMDHIGTLPMISKAYPNAPVYMTVMTAELTRVLLYDSLKIMKYREDEIPHYSEQDVLAMLGRVHAVGYQIPFPLFDKFTLTFYPAGHIAGAACIYLVTEEGSLFYSGDFSAFAQRTIEGIRIPKLRPDVAVVETTYGNRLHANRMVEEKRLVELVRECIAGQKKILIPVFALGRAQEVLLILRAAIQNQEIPAVPIYVDGMVRDINAMYTRNPTYLKNALGKRILKGNEPFYTKEIQPVPPVQKREELLREKGSVIVLSSSGMLTGGPSAQYAQMLASLEDACIIITGYQDEESPGRQLLNLLQKPENVIRETGNPDDKAENVSGKTEDPDGKAANVSGEAEDPQETGVEGAEGAKGVGDRSLTINGSRLPVRCRIEQVGLSAHGDKSEIMSLIERLSARRIFLVHGNRDAIEELGNELAAEDYRRQVYLPECGQGYEIQLHKKRKQISFQLSHTMQMGRSFTAEDEKRLWDYWREHYHGKIFSVSQIARIWYGKDPDESVLEDMQEIFLHSNYFAPDARRLFLFGALEPEAVAEALKPKEPTIQEIEAQIRTAFPDYGYRKISYYPERREALMQFDFPDSVDRQGFQKGADILNESTGWDIRISPSMNHNAAALQLTMLLGEGISRTSYYQDRKCYAVTLAGGCDRKTAKEAAEKFRIATGWTLMINGRVPEDVSETEGHADKRKLCTDGGRYDVFSPEDDSVEMVEQNMAFYCIDQVFEEKAHKPDKKSLRQDGQGRYLELSFVSPVIGRQYQEEIQLLSNQIGWRIRIADKVNQNTLFKTAQVLCMKYGIVLKKNPSYLPEKKSVQLKVCTSDNRECFRAVEEEFLRQTGCSCEFCE